jgi:hypothetical protein
VIGDVDQGRGLELASRVDHADPPRALGDEHPPVGRPGHHARLVEAGGERLLLEAGRQVHRAGRARRGGPEHDGKDQEKSRADRGEVVAERIHA